MGTLAQGNANINEGDKIKNLWLVKKKLGEGSCGSVYLVQNLKEGSTDTKAAMKIEPFMKSPDDEILKMEVFVLKKLQKSKHACKFFMAGKEKNFSFMIISLLGKDLSDLRRRYPDRKMPVTTSLKVAMQTLQAVEDLHKSGFLHRDIKPPNFACGVGQQRSTIFLFDYGLARMYMDGNGNLRAPRPKVSFRGTVRYCSINVHRYKEQGRHDDLFSWLYTMIETLTSTLPWKGLQRHEAGDSKEKVSTAELCKHCPPSFTSVNNVLKKLKYKDEPPYNQIREWLRKDLEALKVKMNEPIDWAKVDEKPQPQTRKVKEDEKAEHDVMPDSDTNRDAPDDSLNTEGSDGNTDTKGFAPDNTLDDLPKDHKKNHEK